MWRSRDDEPEVTIWDKPKGHVIAELDAPDDVDDELEFAALAVDAIFALGLFEPLSVDVDVAFCDLEFGYPLMEPEPVARFHQLGLASLPEWVELSHFWNNTRETRCEQLDRATILDWLGTILAEQEHSPDTLPGWNELRVRSVRARLPRAFPGRVKNGRLRVGQGRGAIDFPVERFADVFWVAGPLAGNSDTAPFDVRVVNEGGSLTFHLRASWSLWIEGIGQLEVEEARDRLSAMGWDVRPFMVGGI